MIYHDCVIRDLAPVGIEGFGIYCDACGLVATQATYAMAWQLAAGHEAIHEAD